MTNNFEKCKLIQAELAAHDLYQDEINGVWNANTQVAFNKYLHSKKDSKIVDLINTDLVWNDTKTPWMSVAWKEQQKTLTNEMIAKYYQGFDDKISEDLIPWNSAFACWCVDTVVKDASPRSHIASKWCTWGEEIAVPIMGCVVVIADGKRPQRARVGFFIHLNEKTKQVYILGANFSDKISIAAYPTQRVLSYRWLEI